MNKEIEKIMNTSFSGGWLDREGNFYDSQNFYTNVWEIATYILHKKVTDLERSGWVRISNIDYFCLCPLSPAQRNFLKVHGIRLKPKDL